MELLQQSETVLKHVRACITKTSYIKVSWKCTPVKRYLRLHTCDQVTGDSSEHSGPFEYALSLQQNKVEKVFECVIGI